MSNAELRVPRWAEIATLVLSLIGLALSIYLTVAHYEGTQVLYCSNSGFIDCAKVTTSAQSHFLGIPVALLGLSNYVVMCVLNSPWMWHARQRWIHVARFLLSIAGMCFILWLVYAEIEIIGSICLYCTYVHITTFALLIVMTIVCPTQLGWSRSRAS